MSKLRIFIFVLTAVCLSARPVAAQSVKTVTVSDGKSYTDHIALAEDSRDTDVMVKFIFDEKNNSLTVSVLSYRRLFVFREAARYSQIIRCRRLLPEHLPYVAFFVKSDHYSLSKALKKSIPAPRSEYVFRRWLEYDGLQPVPTDYKMVNDYIEQEFNIQGKRTSVTVTLRDIYLLDSDEKNANHYILSLGRDLNRKYQVNIVRNPCLGMQDEIASATQSADAVKKAFETLRQTCPRGEVSTEEAFKSFQDMQKTLLFLYSAKDEQVDCPDLAKVIHRYNTYVDSLGRLSCKLAKPEDAAWTDTLPLDTKLLYTQTRQLDNAVARWLVSKDELEKRDLIAQCQDIITDVTAMIRQHKVTTPEEIKAVQAYTQAERFFRKTCKK